jgi:large subunit ribosomal protein L18
MRKIELQRQKRHKRISGKISASLLPRLSVFRSSKHIYANLIADGKTVFTVSDQKLQKKVTKVEKAKEVGKEFAEKALKNKFKRVVFDRAGYLYHGRVKALAEGAREGGLKF